MPRPCKYIVAMPKHFGIVPKLLQSEHDVYPVKRMMAKLQMHLRFQIGSCRDL